MYMEKPRDGLSNSASSSGFSPTFESALKVAPDENKKFIGLVSRIAFCSFGLIPPRAALLSLYLPASVRVQLRNGRFQKSKSSSLRKKMLSGRSPAASVISTAPGAEEPILPLGFSVCV